MREGGGNPLETWFTDVPPRARPWVMWFTIGIVLFGVAMTLLWILRGGG